MSPHLKEKEHAMTRATLKQASKVGVEAHIFGVHLSICDLFALRNVLTVEFVHS
jgi:hypothetical protein